VRLLSSGADRDMDKLLGKRLDDHVRAFSYEKLGS
jgi:hypothetical protein